MTGRAYAIEVAHNPVAARFEARVGGGLARADYRLADGRMVIYHTEVPVAYEGRGIAARIVRAALEHARAEGLKVVPACSYVRAYLRRHPEYQPLVDRAP